MAMGKGIVASRLEQLAEVLEHDRTAWLVTPGNVEELAEAIRRLSLDPAKRDELGVNARSEAIERHSWARNVTWALTDMPAPARDHQVVMSTADETTLTPRPESSPPISTSWRP
jgi:hypothetical protein